MTKYRILRRTAEGDYEVMGFQEGHGPQQAIRKKAETINGLDPDGEMFVAVPENNWTEEPVSMETPPPRLKVGGAPIEGQVTIDDALEGGDDVDPKPGPGSEER